MTEIPPNIQHLRDQRQAIKNGLTRFKKGTITQTRKELVNKTTELLRAELDAQKLSTAKQCNPYHGLD